jgi:hypothetical protein
MDEKTKDFLKEYRALCELYGMYIEAYSSESGMDIGTGIEHVVCPSEIENHIKELEKTS